MLVETKHLNGGVQQVQKVYRFANNFGASVVRHAYSYGGPEGLWELAVIRWESGDWEIVYDTPITGGVLGYLTEQEVEENLGWIEALPDPNFLPAPPPEEVTITW